MTQTVVPEATNVNEWTTVGASTPHEATDEGVDTSDDSTTYVSGEPGKQLDLDLDDPSLEPPSVNTGHKIRVRAMKLSVAGNNIQYQVRLRQKAPNAHNVVTFASQAVTGSWATYEHTLTEAQAADIDADAYGRIRLTFWGRTGGPPVNTDVRISACEFVFPDPVAGRNSRELVEVVSKSPPFLRASRELFEVVSKSPPFARLSREAAEVVSASRGFLRHSREGVEVVSKSPPFARLSRVLAEVASRSPPLLRLSRLFVAIVMRSPGMVNCRNSRLLVEVVSATGGSKVVTPQDLPAVLTNFFLANWAANPTVEESYSTNISGADTGDEDRKALISRPNRNQTVRFTGLDLAQSALLVANMRRQTMIRSIAPLFSDHSRVLSDSSGTTIWCATSNRRFYKGARIGIMSWSTINRPEDEEYHVIQEVFSDRLALETSLSKTFPSGSRCYPIADWEINLQSVARRITDQHADITMTLHEVQGPSALPPTAFGEVAGLQTYQGIPIFNIKPEWSGGIEIGVERPGTSYGSGRARVVEPNAEAAAAQEEVPLLFLSRAGVWEFKRFFDSRVGRARSFWYVSVQSLYRPVAVSINEVDIEPDGRFEDLEEVLQHVAIVQTDGTIILRSIDSVVDNTTTWRIVFESSIPSITLASIAKCTIAYKARFIKDGIVERWLTDEHCQIDSGVMELRTERDLQVADFDDTLPTEEWELAGLKSWFDASRHTFFGAGLSVDAWQRQAIVESDIYPSLNASVARWDDARGVREPYLAGGPSATATWSVIGFDNFDLNKGHRSLEPNTVQSHLFWVIDRTGRPPWVENGGLTIFISMRYNSSGNLTQKIPFLVRNSSGALMFRWRGLEIQQYETAGVLNSNFTISFPSGWADSDDLLTMCFRFDPGVAAELRVNGAVRGTGPTSVPTGYPMDNLRVETNTDFQVLGFRGNATILRDDGVGAVDFVNTLGWYSRSLSDAEVDQVGSYLAARYGGKWEFV